MADKHVKLGAEGNELLNKAKSKILAENPSEKATDEITVIKSLKYFLGEE